MKKVLSFVIKNNFKNARMIADYIIIALMKHPRPANTTPTYASMIRRTKWDYVVNPIESKRINDDSICRYKIAIYKMRGNRNSILSPSQNPIYDNIIAVHDLQEITDKLEMK